MAETDLSEDVLMDILCWLPVKSLIRFTSVSKRWRSIILSDPKFATSQFKAARQRNTVCRRLIFSTDAPQLECLNLDDPPPCGRKLTFPFEQPTSSDEEPASSDEEPEDSYVRLLGSCNGLVFIAFNDSYFYIWNPSTRFFMQFPKPVFLYGKHLAFYGVGYLSATDDYIVFAASYDLDAEMEEIKMFSLRAHLWKAIQNPDIDAIYNRGTLLNEALHWVKLKTEIIVFDLAQEEFKTMSLPDIAQRRCDQKYRNLGVSGGTCVYLVV